MARSKRQMKAAAALNYDLFQPEQLTAPPPATLSQREMERLRRRQRTTVTVSQPQETASDGLPTVEELYRRFEYFNWIYFAGKLPKVRIEYSNRMTSAGSYTPSQKLIKLGRKYHEVFPEDINDTLKHEMIHIRHYRHDAKFKAEARRIGCSVKARHHPSLQRPAKYIYECPMCRAEYPRQKRLRMASCGECSPGRKYDERFKLQLKASQARRGPK